MTGDARVGFVGLGNQGGPMAARIATAGHLPTTVWARRPATLEPFADVPFSVAPDLEALGAASDVACICVVDDAGVLEVAEGLLTGMAPGSTIVVHSTVHPRTCLELAERAAARSVTVVDAPVSGGGDVAAAGELVVMVGGAPADVRRCRPVFASYAKELCHLGPLGSGQVAKLLNNLLFTANLATATATFDLARRLGLDLDGFASVLAGGSGRSYGAEVVTGGEFSAARLGPLAGALLRKDIEIAVDLAGDAPAGASAFAAARVALDLMG